MLASVPALSCRYPCYNVPTYDCYVSLVFDVTMPSLLSLPSHMS